MIASAYSEKEAGKKFCPFVGIVNLMIVVAGLSKKDEYTVNVYCGAGQCMMWRWCTDNPRENRKGYCGLAGRV